jgi:hypothetical protein
MLEIRFVSPVTTARGNATAVTGDGVGAAVGEGDGEAAVGEGDGEEVALEIDSPEGLGTGLVPAHPAMSAATVIAATKRKGARILTEGMLEAAAGDC